MNTPVLLSYAFRPFFLLGAVYSTLSIALWLAAMDTGFRSVTPYWHAHELLIGFGLAAVAGFSLTAVAVWTGRPNVRGLPLAVLISCWLAGRLAMNTSMIGPVSTAVLDMLFPLLLTLLFGREVIAARNRRNYKLVSALAVITVLNGAWHLGHERLATYLLIHAFLVTVAIVAGRITPAFTANWLKQQGASRLPSNPQWLGAVAVSLSVLTGMAAAAWPSEWVTGGMALVTAIAHGLRLALWRGLSTLSNPLLFVLHVAYAWLPIGYLWMAMASFGWWVTPSSALHAMTMGGIGFVVLGVITRVALGHTGRPLKAARLTVLAYWVLALSVVIRISAPWTGAHNFATIELAAALWALAFGLFLWVYWPILTKPRPA